MHERNALKDFSHVSVELLPVLPSVYRQAARLSLVSGTSYGNATFSSRVLADRFIF